MTYDSLISISRIFQSVFSTSQYTTNIPPASSDLQDKVNEVQRLS